MSKKGRSPDNAHLARGVFVSMKLEMFYGRGWSGVSLQDFMKAIDGCLVWFRNGRIKTALGSMTPVAHRQSLGYDV